MKPPSPITEAPFTPADLADLACHLEDEAGHGISNKAAGRLLASVEHVERLLLAMVEPADGAFPRDDARVYLTSRGLLPAAPDREISGISASDLNNDTAPGKPPAWKRATCCARGGNYIRLNPDRLVWCLYVQDRHTNGWLSVKTCPFCGVAPVIESEAIDRESRGPVSR